MVIAEHRQHAAKRRRSSRIGMFEDIPGSIDAWRFAIPNAKQSIALRAWEQAELLATPNRGGTEVFIQTFPELHIMSIEPLLRCP
eukprot:CAMPEP_0184421236 /NCGR_PEP_ID=MMETSP0738-20130409/60781_1 /TAXON_ID=385413 /ORGANISM="Thalassiosira miniscula, Strain CCMP1093" /LENGTH=84 /DNA_ID=CAMNT_0026782495 /DNA_START=152 /DNA_END=406 /DNA_ORIENTATION=+